MSIHACCTGCTVPFFASPSIVVICLSSTEATGVTQDVVGLPSTRTMHAPHWDIPHPNFVPVSPRSSRRANWRVTPSTSGRVYSVPLTESFALVISVLLTRSRGVFASGTSFAWKIVRRARQMLAIDLAVCCQRNAPGPDDRRRTVQISGGEQGG